MGEATNRCSPTSPSPESLQDAPVSDAKALGIRPTTPAPPPATDLHPQAAAAARRPDDPLPQPVAQPRHRAMRSALRLTVADRRRAAFRLRWPRTGSSNLGW